eukprot:CAMPEP_0113495656 /NCGR_PEP_ID=MMETSP0014_2-20120614/29721_1 /TAXON_ID=2857 /ORGANISM="Nitzschia sp." /LENGTH=588 /DNA_ID=CAMNT_0000389559 /DNA_START=118 /DNA_END=1884 /DNA_ORIENTATION=+ /assembly_acc=CAM_ASM_000159
MGYDYYYNNDFGDGGGDGSSSNNSSYNNYYDYGNYNYYGYGDDYGGSTTTTDDSSSSWAFSSSSISASDWTKGIVLSVLASIIGGVSKIMIRKSWLMEREHELQEQEREDQLQEEEGEGGQHRDGGDDDAAGADDAENDEERQRQGGETGGTYMPPPPSSNTATEREERVDRSNNAMTTTMSSSTLPRRDLSSSSLSSSSSSQQELLPPSSSDADAERTTRRSRNATTDRKPMSLFCCSWTTWGLLSMSKIIRYCGMVGMSVLNPVCCVWAMNYASPSILAPFSGLTLVWVILLSPAVVQETPSCQAQIACVLIIVGEVVVALFGDHTNDEGVTVNDVLESYKRPSFLAYFGVVILYETMLCYFILVCHKSSKLQRYAWGSAGGTLTGMQNFLKDSLTILKASKQQQDGSSMTRLLLTSTASSSSGSIHWSFYVFIALAGGTAFAGLLVLTSCMKRYDATYSAASFVGSFVVSASIMSIVHYNTFQELNSLVNYVLYPTGVCILMLGVYVLVQDTSDSSSEVPEENDGLMTFVATGSNDDDDENCQNGTGRRQRADTREENERIFGYSQVVEDDEEATEQQDGVVDGI